jgi:hypothetical protein
MKLNTDKEQVQILANVPLLGYSVKTVQDLAKDVITLSNRIEVLERKVFWLEALYLEEDDL